MAVQILHQDSHAPGGIDLLADPDDLTIGNATMRRGEVSSVAVAVGSGTLRLAYFTARRTETATQVRTETGATPASATPTLCRVGYFSVAGNGDLALIAAIANDTSLWAAASTPYSRNLLASLGLVAGVRYASGLLVVTAGTAPTFTGQASLNSTEAATANRLSGAVTGLTDLPSTVANASIIGSGSRHYTVILP